MIYIADLKILYIPVPKVACTTLKTQLFFLQNGYYFKSIKLGSTISSIHSLSPTISQKEWVKKVKPINLENTFKFAVVRDPLQRFLSCYANRVVYHKDMQKPSVLVDIKKHSLDPIPTLDEFIEKFHLYKEISISIAHHAAPLTDYLGVDSDFYDKIYDISDIDDLLLPDLAEITYCDNLKPISTQTGGSSKLKLNRSILSDQQINKIQNIYQKDYEVYSSWIK